MMKEWKAVVMAVALACSPAGAAQQGDTASGVQVSASAEVSTTEQPTDLRAQQAACLQEKAVQASKAQGGLAKLFNTDKAPRYQNVEWLENTAGKIYTAGATMGDLKRAAADLGISDSDIDACRKP